MTWCSAPTASRSTPKLAELLAASGVRVLRKPVARFEGDDGRLKRIVLERGEPLDRDAVFIATVLHQRSDLAARLGCTTLPDGCVEVDELAGTSVPGVYAAGDMAHRAALPRPFAAVSWASASGTLAGAMLDQDLVAADYSLQAPDPVPGPRTAPPARTVGNAPPTTPPASSRLVVLGASSPELPVQVSRGPGRPASHNA
jgi:NADPH-dependent 2,4-dienoyl-CoA reductase/sulfur reductase-like enzyme